MSDMETEVAEVEAEAQIVTLDSDLERLNALRDAAEAWQAHVERYARLINGWPAGLTRYSMRNAA